ncbi:hypothetical protein HY024_02470 [Candidatus Curtissbacteria bacterium]|nr:hypothetical protein [Candidatus Curtissbacteria bacterium]
MVKKNLKKTAAKFIAVALAVLLRLLPHLPNFTPLGALGLVSGSYFGKKTSLTIIVTSMLASDYLLLYINPYSQRVFNFSKLYSPSALVHTTSIFVYSSLILNVFIGHIISKQRSAQYVLLGSFLASIQFFLITNFGVWVMGAYNRGLDGLLQSYSMGLPFFKWTLFGDLAYTIVLFGLFEYANKFTLQRSLNLFKVTW